MTLSVSPILWKSPTLNCVLMAFVVMITRRPDVFAYPQFWAEDSRYFYQAYLLGAETLWMPLYNYHVFLIRLTAYLGLAIPIEYVPHFYAFISFVIIILTCRLLCLPSMKFRHPYLMVLAMLFVPHQGEVFLNITNIQWYCGIMVLLVLVSRTPESPGEFWFLMGCLLFAGLTGPYALVLAPVSAWVWLARRDRFSALKCVLTSVISVFHGMAILNAKSEHNPLLESFDSWNEISDWCIAISRRLAGEYFFTPYGVDSVPQWFLVALTVGLGVFVLRRAHQQKERALGWLLFGALLVTLSVIYHQRENVYSISHFGGSRYFFIQMVTMSFCLVQCIRRFSWKEPALWLLAFATLSALLEFRANRYPNMHWNKWSQCIRENRRCSIPHPPAGMMTFDFYPKPPSP